MLVKLQMSFFLFSDDLMSRDDRFISNNDDGIKEWKIFCIIILSNSLCHWCRSGGDFRHRPFSVAEGLCSDPVAITVGSCCSSGRRAPTIDYGFHSFALIGAGMTIGHSSSIVIGRGDDLGSGRDPLFTFQLAEVGRMADSECILRGMV